MIVRFLAEVPSLIQHTKCQSRQVPLKRANTRNVLQLAVDAELWTEILIHVSYTRDKFLTHNAIRNDKYWPGTSSTLTKRYSTSQIRMSLDFPGTTNKTH